jgi:hypothetical protein
MNRRRAFTSLVSTAVFAVLLSAIASAGIYGVVSVVQSEAALLDDSDDEQNEAPVESGLIVEQAGSPAVAADVALEDGIAVRINRLSAGRLVPASRADVILVQEGQVVDRFSLGQGGVAQLGAIPNGYYTLVARGTDGFAVVRAGLTTNADFAEFGLCPWVDMALIDGVLQNDVYRSATVATYGDTVAPGTWPSVLDGNGFALRDDGTVRGRATFTPALGDAPRAIVNSRVLFVRGGEIIAEARTNAAGEFEMTGLTPGAASFVIASNLGFLAIATQIGAAEEIVNAEGSEVRFVNYDDGQAPNGEPAPPGDVQAAGGATGPGGPGGPVGPGEPGGPGGPPGPLPLGGGGGGGLGGGGGGFAGGGGGVGGGGGLFGPLLAGAAGAALGWALADDDDDDDSVSP